MFQSTHPRGVRLGISYAIRKSMIKFQSTHPRGVRHRQKPIHRDHFVSIHAPTRGATLFTFSGLPYVLVSIHAPTRGATFYAPFLWLQGEVSIHAPTRGATSLSVERNSYYKFQSTHPRGVRLPMPMQPMLIRLFQSTHPRGVRRNFDALRR